MFTAAFWKATFERVVRAAAAAMAGVWLVGDQISDQVQTNLHKTLTVGWATAVMTLLLCLAGNFVTKSGPSFNQTETVVKR